MAVPLNCGSQSVIHHITGLFNTTKRSAKLENNGSHRISIQRKHDIKHLQLELLQPAILDNRY